VTSAENLDRVREVYAEWAQGNMRAGPAVFDAEIAFESFLPDAEERVTVRGLAEVEQFMREFLRQWHDYRLIGDEFRQIGSDTVLVLGHQTATGRQSGVTVESPMSSVWTFREGKVVHLLFEPDPQKVLAAAGAGE
jgi:ketosteroid isomerase-like protein